MAFSLHQRKKLIVSHTPCLNLRTSKENVCPPSKKAKNRRLPKESGSYPDDYNLNPTQLNSTQLNSPSSSYRSLLKSAKAQVIPENSRKAQFKTKTKGPNSR